MDQVEGGRQISGQPADADQGRFGDDLVVGPSAILPCIFALKMETVESPGMAIPGLSRFLAQRLFQFANEQVAEFRRALAVPAKAIGLCGREIGEALFAEDLLAVDLHADLVALAFDRARRHPFVGPKRRRFRDAIVFSGKSQRGPFRRADVERQLEVAVLFLGPEVLVLRLALAVVVQPPVLRLPVALVAGRSSSRAGRARVQRLEP